MAKDGAGLLSLIRSHGRGVDFLLVADRCAPCDLQEGVGALAAVGIPVLIDALRLCMTSALIAAQSSSQLAPPKEQALGCTARERDSCATRREP
jgi:hypothetical protein